MSPQGGNCAVFWDNSGGGNTNVLRRELDGPAMLEAWVHFDAPALVGTQEFLHWNIGFGTTGTFANKRPGSFRMPPPRGVHQLSGPIGKRRGKIGAALILWCRGRG